MIEPRPEASLKELLESLPPKEREEAERSIDEFLDACIKEAEQRATFRRRLTKRRR